MIDDVIYLHYYKRNHVISYEVEWLYGTSPEASNKRGFAKGS
ncbi:hypothetical protein GCM10008013_03470 [Paenibacillus segetis]|uniref:Uncharacterized protein n=1 Tax=Paenibacillus segetis TaxID=1325360 RepID=A0ABQ1Y504_9BACL|nr:hypothetical protein GCM10008013_03470 [Paenibacillus segetis]